MEYAPVLLDIAIGVGTLLGMLAAGVGAVWVFARKRVRAWWNPYRAAIESMREMPVLQDGIKGVVRDMAELRSDIGMLALHVRARSDANIDAAEFECGVDGAISYVSQTFARWLGVGKADLMHWNWINYVHADDRRQVRLEWDQCRLEHRTFRLTYRMLTGNGEVLRVEVMITPLPDAPPAQQWIGVMRREA